MSHDLVSVYFGHAVENIITTHLHDLVSNTRSGDERPEHIFELHIVGQTSICPLKRPVFVAQLEASYSSHRMSPK